MRINRRNNSRESSGLDLTTCSDIIFTLLIFYILSQSYVTSVPAGLPKLKANTRTIKGSAVQIMINASGTISIDRKNLPEAWEKDFVAQIVGKASDTEFLIVAENNAPAGMVIEILDRLRSKGFSEVAFAGFPEENE
ncbi:MAG: hypothetical protein Kow0029_11510 [Candidatus Rifleibacteriota bacterium]